MSLTSFQMIFGIISGSLWDHAKIILELIWVYSIEDPQGGRPPPHFYSRRFYGSVCGRTKSLSTSNRNVKGNFAWVRTAGSRRVLGRFSAESRQIWERHHWYQLAPRGGQQKTLQTAEETAGKRKRKMNEMLVDFGSILGGFLEHFGSQNAPVWRHFGIHFGI